MSEESAIGSIASAIEKLGFRLKDFDFTPMPSKKQFVRGAAVEFLSALLRREKDEQDKNNPAFFVQDGVAIDAVRLAEKVWDESQKVGN